MADQFVVLRNDPGEVSPSGGLTSTMVRIKNRTEAFSSPFEIFERGSKTKAYRRMRKDALQVYKNKLAVAEIGEVWVYAERRGDDRVEARKVLEGVALPDQADLWPQDQVRVFEFIMGTFPGVRWGGTCNCRDNRQGTGLSDHACCHAGDFFPASTKQGNEIYRQLMANEDHFNIRYIAWQVALHYDHLHVATGAPCSGCF